MAGPSLRRLSMAGRRAALFERVPGGEELMRAALDGSSLQSLAELMVECPVGFFGVPLGVATGFLVDGETLDVPMATEEPSVVAAASYAAGLVAHAGGFCTSAQGDLVTAQVWLEGVGDAGLAELSGGRTSGPGKAAFSSDDILISNYQDISQNMNYETGYTLSAGLIARIGSIVDAALPSLVKRGGGFAGADLAVLREPAGLVRIHIHIRVCDAMGANLANTAAEAVAPFLEEITGGRALARILTNESPGRMAQASFRLPVRFLRRAGLPGSEVARRIALFSAVAAVDRARAVTHNKGVMNGVSALVLATGNDTRAVEAAVHAHAAMTGRYLPLTEYRVEEDTLCGMIRIPVPLGTASSTGALHPGARLSLAILGAPSAARLGRIAAALGLAQNLAAMAALVSEGIQAGHMRLHARRTAYLAGARGDLIDEVAGMISREGMVNLDAARRVLETLRRGEK